MDQYIKRQLDKLGIPFPTQSMVTITRIVKAKDGLQYVVLDFPIRLKRIDFMRIIRILKHHGAKRFLVDVNTNLWIWNMPLYSWVDADREISYAFSDPPVNDKNAKTLRNVLLSLPRNRCAACGITEEATEKGLQLHHIVPLEYGGDDRDGNTVVLCSKCHARVHALYRRTAINRELTRNRHFFEEVLLRYLTQFDRLE